jgi:hypothetical protein
MTVEPFVRTKWTCNPKWWSDRSASPQLLIETTKCRRKATDGSSTELMQTPRPSDRALVHEILMLDYIPRLGVHCSELDMTAACPPPDLQHRVVSQRHIGITIVVVSPIKTEGASRG